MIGWPFGKVNKQEMLSPGVWVLGLLLGLLRLLGLDEGCVISAPWETRSYKAVTPKRHADGDGRDGRWRPFEV